LYCFARLLSFMMASLSCSAPAVLSSTLAFISSTEAENSWVSHSPPRLHYRYCSWR
jgi:hypothetical protein